jgi:hypothetical protein
MNLIINANLSSDPPSEGLYFRFLTMVSQKDLDYCVVLESEKNMIDKYYHFLKKRGWFDYVNDIIVPEWREEGVRLDTELSYPLTVKAEYIRCENTPLLLGQLKTLRNLPPNLR